MKSENCILIGAPVDSGKRRRGCLMGPDAYRTANLAEALRALGHRVEDRGNVAPLSYITYPLFLFVLILIILHFSCHFSFFHFVYLLK